MFRIKSCIVPGIHLCLCAAWTLAMTDKDAKYSNTWVAKIEGGEDVAQRVAKDLGYKYKNKFSFFEDYYVLVKEDHPRISLRDGEQLTSSLLDIDEVKWAKRQKVVKIAYKDLKDVDELKIEEKKLDTYLRQRSIAEKAIIKEDESIFSHIRIPLYFRNLFVYLCQGNISNLGMFPTTPRYTQLTKFRGITKNIQLLPWKISSYEIQFLDPLWKNQWYFQDYRTTDKPVMDHNVVPVYRMGYTGEGVTIGVVDSPIQVDHPDLQENIDMENSFDICKNLPLKSVMEDLKPTEHGTIAAGIIGMVANNNNCGVGVAYKAKIAVINNDCKEDMVENLFTQSILANFEKIDIYSNSWGPEDDPEKVHKFGELTQKAYDKGVTEGRGGKGIIYVHSAGNGGVVRDVCATDPVVNHPNIIAVTSANQHGKKSDYGKRCSGVFATTYSGGKNKVTGKAFDGVVSLNADGECNESVHGSSTSAPLASGMIALMLQAKPELTYRDVMHIIARSAEVAPLANNDSWYRNGMGFWVSNEFGFGLMNAENMINVAKTWETVPTRHTCTFTVVPETAELEIKSKVIVPFTTDGCQSTIDTSVHFLEHMLVTSVIEYPVMGDILVSIISPKKTRSVLLSSRRRWYTTTDGLEDWTVMSTHNWGEDPNGLWTIEVKIKNRIRSQGKSGQVKEFKITFHGIGGRPTYLEERRTYAPFRLPTGEVETGNIRENV